VDIALPFVTRTSICDWGMQVEGEDTGPLPEAQGRKSSIPAASDGAGAANEGVMGSDGAIVAASNPGSPVQLSSDKSRCPEQPKSPGKNPASPNRKKKAATSTSSSSGSSSDSEDDPAPVQKARRCAWRYAPLVNNNQQRGP
jgi:hypothetical protein